MANIRLRSPQLVILAHNADVYLFAPRVLQSFCLITLLLLVLTDTSAESVSDEGGKHITRTRLWETGPKLVVVCDMGPRSGVKQARWR